MLVAAQAAGGAKAALEMTVEYAKTREQFGKPLGAFQSISHYLADAATASEGGSTLVYEAAWMLFSAKEGHLGAWLKGKYAFMRAFREARRKRRWVQRRRKIGDRALLVGGPLTLSPNLAASKGLGARLLDGVLRAWWGLCRWVVV